MNHAAEQFQQWGYWAVGRLAMFLVDPLSFSKYFSFFTLLATCLFAFFLVRKRFGPVAGMAAVVLVGQLTFERMVGSNGRSFGFPALMMFLYFFADGRWRGVAIALVISSLFYPTVLLMELVMLGLHGMRWAFLHRNNFLKTNSSQRSQIAVLSFTAVLSVIIPVTKSWQISTDPLIGPMFSAKELLTLPMFGSEKGRVDFPGEMRLIEHVLSNGLKEVEYVWPLLAVAILMVLAAATQGSKRLCRFDCMLLYLPLAGIGLLLLARWQLPRLFLPTRFLTFMYPVFFSLLLARLLGTQAGFFEKKWAAALLLAALTVVPFWMQSGNTHSQTVYSDNSAVFEKIRKLPPDHGLIAGPMFSCDMVPMFCQRSVLFSYEGFHALYFKNYWEKMAEAYRDYLGAITSPDPSSVRTFVKKHKVSYIILDKRLLEQGKKIYNFPPFDEYLEGLMAANPNHEFAVLKFPSTRYTDVDGRHRLLDCRNLLNE